MVFWTILRREAFQLIRSVHGLAPLFLALAGAGGLFVVFLYRADGTAETLPALWGLATAFGLPFLEPQSPRPAVVDVSWGYLNIRDKPDTNSAVIARAYDGARLTVLNQWQGWYVVRFDNVVGWANGDFITLL